MSKQLWHQANRIVHEDQARSQRPAIIVRLVALTLSSSVLALTGTDTSAAQPSDNPAATAKETSISTVVRSEKQDELDRLIFEFATPAHHVIHKDGDQLVIWFDQRRQFDLGKVETSKDRRLRRVEAVGDDATRWIILHLAPESQHRSAIGDDGRRLTVTLASPDHQLASSGDNAAAANAQKRTAAPSDHLSASWTPRRRPLTETASEAPKTKPHAPSDHGAPTAETPAAPKALVGPGDQAAPKVNVAAYKKRPDIPAKPKPVKEARLDVAAPGQFEVDELTLDRALERTLTREGAVLLPFGMVEIEPGISYVRREFDAPTLVNLFGFPAFGETVVRRNEVSATLAARVGLPLDSQLELDVPYRYVDQSAVTTIGFSAIEETDDSAYAFGDIGVSLAKTLLREDHWWPDAVARVRWDSGTGKTADNGVALGGGTHELTGSVSVVKSQDPLAFFGTVAYEKTFEENDIDRGDRIGVAVGTVLAASPDTSLRASIQQDFIGDAEVDGDDIAGSDQLAASLRLGASSVLGQGVLLDASVDVGLTEDAPDYAARLSLPIRFNPSGFFPFEDRDEGEGEREDED